MRKLLSFLLVLFAGITVVLAQPQKMTYQAVVRDANNELVVNQLVGIQVSIYEDYINGPLIYCETHTATTNGNALVTIEIGTGVHVYITSLANVQWGKHDHFLKVEIDPAGGTNYSITGTQQLVSVPYAFYAEAAKLVDTAKYAANALHADTAYYLANFQNSDTSKFAFNSDTSAFAYYANNADNANNANTAIYADTADYNKLLNKPIGTNMGDILYWDTVTSSWHILPVGNIGEVLTLDSSFIPQWNAGGSSNSLPIVVTYPVNSHTGDEADVSGEVTNGGGTPFVVGGFCWSQNPNPDITDYHSMDGLGVMGFSHNITGLNLGTTYYFKAYGMNNAGIQYGNEEQFTTWDYPTVTTNSPVTTISATDAYCGGNVTADGGATVSQRGVVWSRWNTTPSIDDNEGFTNDGSGIGSFSSHITGLEQGVTYYVCAYATNDVGPNYGNTITFTTLNVPSVTTNSPSGITDSSAVSGGNVTDDGGDTVTIHGILWSDLGCPDINSYTGIKSHGVGIAPFTFTDTMGGLAPRQTYYVVAYAQNNIGIAYGDCESFQTPPAAPTVTTGATVTNILAESAECSGELVDNGSDDYAQIGLCWDTVANPVLGNNNYTYEDWYDGWGLPYQFNHYFSGLTDGKTYWVRAYAINNADTVYGAAVSFTTLALPTVVTAPITNIGTSGANSGGNVISGGSYNSISAAGVCWDTVPNPVLGNNNYSEDGSNFAPFSYTSLIFDLNDSTTYYVRAYATTAAGTGYGQVESFTTYAIKACPGTPTVTDYDGNVYNTVQIGNQCWMRENLRTTHYYDGTDIIEATIVNSNVPLRYKPSCSWDQVPEEYGYLYNWAAVMNGAPQSGAVPSGVQGVCPTGWHVPSHNEWQLLINYVRSQASWVCNSYSPGRAMASQNGWWYCTPDQCAIGSTAPSVSRNTSGFSILPAGYYYQNGNCSEGYMDNSYFWSSTASYSYDTTYADYCQMSCGDSYLNIYGGSWDMGTYKYYGMSVRCIQDYVLTDGNPCPGTPTVSDNDGNTYNTVEINGQCWMKENLRTTKYPDGTSIGYGQGMGTSSTTGYYYHVNNNTSNDATYGLLYNWPAAMNYSNVEGTQGICPTGWHIPTNAESQSLTEYVRMVYPCYNQYGDAYNGKALASNANWNYNSSICDAGYDLQTNNATGYTAQPAGYFYGGSYYYFGKYSCIRDSRESSNMGYSDIFCLSYSDAYTSECCGDFQRKDAGVSVRCIKD